MPTHLLFSLPPTEAWPEILPALFQCTKSPSPEHRESAFRIFTSVPNLISGQHADILKSVFAESLRDENLHVRNPGLTDNSSIPKEEWGVFGVLQY